MNPCLEVDCCGNPVDGRVWPCYETPVKKTTMQIFTIKVVRNETEKKPAKVLGTFEDIIAPNAEAARREVLVSDKFKKMLGTCNVQEVSLPAVGFPVSE